MQDLGIALSHVVNKITKLHMPEPLSTLTASAIAAGIELSVRLPRMLLESKLAAALFAHQLGTKDFGGAAFRWSR